MASTIWKGHLTFGLVSFPVKLYSAARADSISFNQLHKTDNSRIRQVIYCKAEDKEVPRAELVKGYEYEKDKFVIIDDEDIKKIAPPTARTMEILEFVKSSEVDPVYFEASYYMAPDDAGERPYALLYDVLKKSGYVGVAKIAMHSREHIVIFRPGQYGLLMHTMYYTNEVRKTDEFRTDATLVGDKERQLAQMLVESLAATFEPEKYHDAYRDNLQKMIDAKVKGQEIAATPAPAPAKVIDIMQALQQSLQMSKKPAGSSITLEAEPASTKPKRRAAGRRAAEA